MDIEIFEKKLAEQIVFFTNTYENAVIKSEPDKEGFMVKFKGKPEFKAKEGSELVTDGIFEANEITQQEYDNFSPDKLDATIFSAQIDFSKYGKEKKDIIILHKWNLQGADFNEFGKYHDITFAAAKEYFGATINATDRAILDLLIKDPLMPPDAIADVIGVSQKKVDVALSKMIKDGLIEVTTEKIKQDDFKTSKQISRTPTAEATKIVDARPPKTYNIDVLYSYEWRDGFSDADIDTSRDFCVTLLKANRLYTREEIETISSRVGRDTWIHKGGWYHDSGRDVNLPYCRHTWVQNLITTEA